MEKTKGFITIATGKEEYYKLAGNLLHSYHYFCDKRLPFAILADRENAYTGEFDDVLIFENGATNSYLDKLSLGEYLPYDINIFIDADCLAYGNLNRLFDLYEEADDFSCFGRVLSLDDKTGWFEYENLGELQSQVSYVVGLHGGIYYMRRGEMTRKVFAKAREMVPDYTKYKFKGKFATPGDEPLVALSMALNQCRPIPFDRKAICCYWEYTDRIDADISRGLAQIDRNAEDRTNLLHWGTRYTRQLVYQREVAVLDLMRSNPDNLDQKIQKCRKEFDHRIRAEKRRVFLGRVKNKLRRMLKL